MRNTRWLSTALPIALLLGCSSTPEWSQDAPEQPARAAQASLAPAPYAYAIDVMQCGTGVHGCLGDAPALGSATCPDDWAAVQACINKNPSAHVYFSKVRAPSVTSTGTYTASVIPDYYFAQPLVPCGADQRLDGSTGSQSGGTNLKFALGSAGITIVKNTTSPSGQPCPVSVVPSGIHVEHLQLDGSAGGVTGPVMANANGIYVTSTRC